MAIALSGQLLLGQPVMVKPSEAEKNLVQSNTSGGAAGVAGPYGAVDRKLYVGNLHFNMTESQLREVFLFCCCFIGLCGEDADVWHISLVVFTIFIRNVKARYFIEYQWLDKTYFSLEVFN